MVELFRRRRRQAPASTRLGPVLVDHATGLWSDDLEWLERMAKTAGVEVVQLVDVEPDPALANTVDC
jgi:hypothetical protein